MTHWFLLLMIGGQWVRADVVFPVGVPVFETQNDCLAFGAQIIRSHGAFQATHYTCAKEGDLRRDPSPIADNLRHTPRL